MCQYPDQSHRGDVAGGLLIDSKLISTLACDSRRLEQSSLCGLQSTANLTHRNTHMYKEQSLWAPVNSQPNKQKHTTHTHICTNSSLCGLQSTANLTYRNIHTHKHKRVTHTHASTKESHTHTQARSSLPLSNLNQQHSLNTIISLQLI